MKAILLLTAAITQLADPAPVRTQVVQHVTGPQLLAPPAPPGATGKARRDLQAKLAVDGPIVFELSSISGEITIEPGPAGEVVLDVKGTSAKKAVLEQRGKDRVRARFDGQDSLRNGDSRVRVPAGTEVVLASVSGAVRVNGTDGDVTVQVVSGELQVTGAKAVNGELVSGSATLTKISGAVQVTTVSGGLTMTSEGEAPQLKFQTTSGILDWTGRCGNGCRIKATSVSGDIRMHMDQLSSFDMSFGSFSGRLKTALRIERNRKRTDRAYGVKERGKFGTGAGVINVATHSGDFELLAR